MPIAVSQKEAKVMDKVMNSDTKFFFLALGIPIAGLIYCGLGITAMATVTGVREHPLLSGGAFFFIPFFTAAFIWMRASAKVYRS